MASNNPFPTAKSAELLARAYYGLPFTKHRGTVSAYQACIRAGAMTPGFNITNLGVELLKQYCAT